MDTLVIELRTNSIPDHNSWAVTSTSISQQDIRVKFPKVPVLLTLDSALQQPVKAGDNGFALNGVALHNPYNMDSCCDQTFDKADS